MMILLVASMLWGAEHNDPPGVRKMDRPTLDPGRQTLSTGLGGLKPLFQIGGPRSIQLALRLQF